MRAGGGPRGTAARRSADIGLLQVGHGREIEFAGRHEGRAAPVRAEPTRIDRIEVTREPCGLRRAAVRLWGFTAQRDRANKSDRAVSAHL
jgi:hypothetical protein